MKKFPVLITLILLTGTIYAQIQSSGSKKLVVKFNATAEKSESTWNSTFNQLELETASHLSLMFPGHQEIKTKNNTSSPLKDIYTIDIPEGVSSESIIQKYQNMPGVAYIEPMPVINLLEVPDDPKTANQYYMDLIHAYDAFDLCKGDTNIVIGIVDTGIDFYHEDLQDNIKFNYNDPINGVDDDGDGYVDNFKGWDMAHNDNDPQCETDATIPSVFHGTSVAGMASPVTNNGVGIAGMGYRTMILPVKIMDSLGTLSTGYQGIVYAADHGCQIINCSWGGTFPSLLGADVIDYALNVKNCLVIAAAGNDGNDVPFYPASLKNVFSVAATNSSDLKWTKSTYGVEVDVCAPGQSVLLTTQNNGYTYGNGTSYAAPLVSGLAALLKAYRPNLTALQLAEQIRITSQIIDNIGDNQYFFHEMGYGRIDAYNALTITDLPSVRIEDLRLQTNENQALLNGDTLYVSFSVTNYLAQVTNTIIKITSDSEYLTPISNEFSTGTLGTLNTKGFSSSPAAFLISSDMPADHQAKLYFTMKDAGYDDYQTFKIQINRSYINVAPNLIQTTLTSNGKIGYHDRINKIGKGFVFNSSDNLLNDAGIIIASGIESMASALFNSYNFETTETIDTLTDDDGWFEGKAQFTALESTNIPILVNQTILASNQAEYNSSIVYQYQIINQGTEALSNLKMGLYTDWDLINYNSNETDFDASLNLFYTLTHTDQIIYAGICLLDKSQGIPYGFDLVEGGNGGMDITSQYSNEQKWFTMTTPRIHAGNDGDSLNVATLLTSAGQALDVSDTLNIAFALIAARNLYELKQQANALQSEFVTNISTETTSAIHLYPNPAYNHLILVNNPDNFKSAQLYNNAGIVVQTYFLQDGKQQLPLENLPAGIYWLHFKNENVSVTKKVVIIR